MCLSRLIFLFLFIPSIASAINLQGFYFSDSYKYAIVDDSFILKHPGNWLFYTSFGYVNRPLVIANAFTNDNEGVVLNNQKVLTLGLNYNFSRTLALGIDASFISTVLSDDTSSLSIAETAANAQGYSIDEGSNLGDITFKAKWRVFQDKETKTAIALIPRFNIGTGSEETFTSSETIGWGIRAVGEKLWNRLAIQGAIGYSHTTEAELGDIDYDQLVNFQAALSYRVLTDFNINLEFLRNVTVGTEQDAEQDVGDYYATFKYKMHSNYDLYGGFGLAGFTDIDEENYTLFAGLKFHPAEKQKRKPVKKSYRDYLEKISDQYIQAGNRIRPVDANIRATGRDVDRNGNLINYTCYYDRKDDGEVDNDRKCINLKGLNFDEETGVVDWKIPKDASGEYEFLIDAYYQNGTHIDSEIFVIKIASREAEKELGALFKADRVYFDNSKTNIKSSEKKKLIDLAKYLKSNKRNVSKVIIEGYASKVGKSSFNRVLSVKRARNVMKFLLSRGVSSDLMQTVAYGDDYLNEEPEHWQNRRVEFRIYNKR